MAYNSETKEITPQQHLSQAAANLAGASDELSQASAVLFERRQQLVADEEAQQRAQMHFEGCVHDFRQLLDQYGLLVSIPEPAPKRF